MVGFGASSGCTWDNSQDTLQTQLYTFAGHINIDHSGSHSIANIRRHATQLADVNQTVCLHTNVHEASKRCDVVNGSGHCASRLQIRHLLQTLFEQWLQIEIGSIVLEEFTTQCLQNAEQLQRKVG